MLVESFWGRGGLRVGPDYTLLKEKDGRCKGSKVGTESCFYRLGMIFSYPFGSGNTRTPFGSVMGNSPLLGWLSGRILVA